MTTGELAGYIDTMAAARLRGHGDLRIESMLRPQIEREADVLLEVSAVGICGSDLLRYKGRPDAGAPGGEILGHEFSATVRELATPNIKDGFGNQLRPGTKVAVDPIRACGICPYCRKGAPNLCNGDTMAHDGSGALCQYVVVGGPQCYPLGEISSEEGALVEPLGVGIHGVTLGKVGIGMSVVIFGGGPIGLCLLQASLLAGAAKVFVVDPLPWRVALAEKLGGVGIAADPTASVELIKSQTGGRGVHVAFEAAWAGETIGQAIETVMPGGRVVLVGIPAQRDEITVVHSSARAKALTLLFLRRTRLNFPAALAVIQASKVTLLPLITHRFDLENAPAAFELNSNYRDSVVKVIIGVK